METIIVTKEEIADGEYRFFVQSGNDEGEPVKHLATCFTEGEAYKYAETLAARHNAELIGHNDI